MINFQKKIAWFSEDIKIGLKFKISAYFDIMV